MKNMFQPNGPTFFELARQAMSSTERGYDLLAPKFDRTPFRTSDEVLRSVAPRVGTIDAALDLCCGTGAGLRMLRPLCRRRVVGVDRSRGMLAEARRRLTDAPSEAPILLVRADLFALPFAAEFDVVTCFGALGHIIERDYIRFARAIHALLRPGGRFIFVTSPPPPPFSRRFWFIHGFDTLMRLRNAFFHPPFVMYYRNLLLPEATALLTANGFSIATAEPLFPASDSPLHVVVAVRKVLSEEDRRK